MMGYSGWPMMGSAGWGWLGFLTWLLVAIDLVLFGLWLWKQINK